MSALRTTVVTELTALDAYAEAWDALAVRCPPVRPTLSHAWVRAFLAHRLAANEAWACALAWRDDTLVGILPLRRRGAHLFNLCDEHTPSGDAVVHAQRDAGDVLDALLHAHGSFRSVRFDGVVPDSPTHAWLGTNPAGRHVLRTASGMTGARVDARPSFDHILSSLSSNTRSKLRKGERLLGGAAGLHFSVHEAPETFDTFLRLEASGWKGQQGTAIGQDPELQAFYEELVRRLAMRGWLRIHVLSVQGEAVAAELVIRFGATLVVHKVAFDERHAKASPGNVIWSRTLQSACDDPDIETVDVLAMDQLMARWGAAPYAYDAFRVFARGLVPSLITRWPAQWRARLARLRRWRAARN